MFDISGKSALITGGTSGIGAAIANQFFAAGCKVIAAGLPDEQPSSTLSPKITVAPLNVSDPASIERLVADLDQLDVLINAAGIIRRRAEYDLEQFQMVIDVNLVGSMRMCTACQPLLLRQGGAVIFLSSPAAAFITGVVLPVDGGYSIN